MKNKKGQVHDIEEKIIKCMRDLELHYQVLELPEFEYVLKDTVENVISLIETGEEGKEYKKYKCLNFHVSIDTKDLTDEVRKFLLKYGFEIDKENKDNEV